MLLSFELKLSHALVVRVMEEEHSAHNDGGYVESFLGTNLV